MVLVVRSPLLKTIRASLNSGNSWKQSGGVKEIGFNSCHEEVNQPRADKKRGTKPGFISGKVKRRRREKEDKTRLDIR